MSGFRLALLSALVSLAACPAAGSTELVTVRVNSFPNAKALPLHAGVAKGIFARRYRRAIDTLGKYMRAQ
jgi:ABC-type nitrate/sulfonate/bicarbonate transport system substrate-binding protein